MQLATLAYTKSSSTVFSLAYGYGTGNNGQVQSITDNGAAGRTAAYTYDAWLRLKTAGTVGSADYPVWGLSWTYDRYGNRTQQTVTAGSAPAPSTPTDPLTNHAVTSGYAYDAAGNMTNDGSNALVYDGENRVATATNGSSSGGYAYDGHGLRVKKCIPNCTSPTSTTVYIFAGSKVIAEYASGAAPSAPSREYIYAGSTLLATIAGGTTSYHISDHLSARVTSDSNGGIAGQQGHFPFGESWYGQSATTKFQFTTYQRDSESVNDYATMRYYVNRVGRFSSPDPLAGVISNPQSLDRYTYVINAPIDLTDPLGLEGGGQDIVCNINGMYFYGGACDFFLRMLGVFGGTPERHTGPANKTSCPQAKGFWKWLPHGLTWGGNGNASIGLTTAGAMADGSVGAGLFISQSGQVSGGMFASGGATAFAGSHNASAPQQSKIPPFAVGAYGGVGTFVGLTNAQSMNQLSGPFAQWNANIGWGPGYSLTFQYDNQSGVWNFSISQGPGWGLSGTAMTTTTAVKTDPGTCR